MLGVLHNNQGPKVNGNKIKFLPYLSEGDFMRNPVCIDA
jgi:hypothetical protein